jgi:hypothetical protein
MAMDIARRISLVLAAAFCAFAVVLRPWHLIYAAMLYQILPIALIWYGEELGEYTSGWHLNAPTPGIIVRILGWILLALTPLVVCAVKLRMEIPAHW